MAEIPNDISIELTYRCNYRCAWCYCGKNKASELSVDDWLKILQVCYDGGARRLMLTGGEPSLYQGWRKIMNGASDIGYTSISLFTNGSLLSEQDLSFLKSLNAYWAVSLSERSQYELLTGATVPYSGVLEKIRRSVELGVPVAVSSVLTTSNSDEMEALVADCHEAGAYHVQLGFIMDSGSAKDNPELFLSPENRKDVVSRYRRLRKNYPRKYISLSTEVECSCRSRLGKCLSWLRGRRCVAGKKYAVITPDGRIKPCFHISDEDWWGCFSKEPILHQLNIGKRGVEEENEKAR